MRIRLRPLLVVCAASSIAALAGCADKLPTDAEVASAVQNCGIPAGGVSLIKGKGRNVLIRADRNANYKYKQFICFVDWLEKQDVTVGFISEERTP
jgi:hypothetical protein